MKASRKSGVADTIPFNNDAELVALIDNELDEDARTALLGQLAADDQLRQPYEDLRQTSGPLVASLDTLLETHRRLRAALFPEHPRREARGASGSLSESSRQTLSSGFSRLAPPYGSH
jgi:anti-sigma factor RsiW